MKIEFETKDLMTPEVFALTQKAAKEEGLPIEVYVFRTYNNLVATGNATIDVKDTVVMQPAAVVRTEGPSGTTEKLPPVLPSEPGQREEDPEPYGPFDHLGLKDGDKGAVRAHNLLEKHFADVDELLTQAPAEILKIKGFGQGSLDTIVEALIKEGHIASIEEMGPRSPSDQAAQLANEETEEEDVEDEDVYELISTLDDDDEGSIPEACRIYQAAWSLEHEVARSQLKEVLGGVYTKADKDTWGPAIQAIKHALPMSPDQRSEILDLGNALGEDQTVTQERSIAMCGKEFSELSYGEAKQLLGELESEWEQPQVEVDDDFTF